VAAVVPGADTVVAAHHTDAVDSAAAATALHEEAVTEADTVVAAEAQVTVRTSSSRGHEDDCPDIPRRYDETSVFLF
jgi:hypothetical protein